MSVSQNGDFFNCYLAVPRPTLGHSRGDSLTNPMLITALFAIWTRRSPGGSQRRWVPKPGSGPRSHVTP